MYNNKRTIKYIFPWWSKSEVSQAKHTPVYNSMLNKMGVRAFLNQHWPALSRISFNSHHVESHWNETSTSDDLTILCQIAFVLNANILKPYARPYDKVVLKGWLTILLSAYSFGRYSRMLWHYDYILLPLR